MTTTLHFDWSDGPSAAVVAAVASELGVEPNVLDVPLNDFVDPDALDALFAPTYDGIGRAEGFVVLSMHGCEVTVRSSGVVSAENPAERVTADGQLDESRTPI